MPVDQRDAWVRVYLEDVFNGHNLQSLDKYMTDDLVSTAYTLNDLFCVGDKGVWRGTWDATQRKEWEGIPPKGRKAKWTVIIVGRFERDKIAEDWVEYDRYNLFRQLEAL